MCVHCAQKDDSTAKYFSYACSLRCKFPELTLSVKPKCILFSTSMGEEEKLSQRMVEFRMKRWICTFNTLELLFSKIEILKNTTHM